MISNHFRSVAFSFNHQIKSHSQLKIWTLLNKVPRFHQVSESSDFPTLLAIAETPQVLGTRINCLLWASAGWSQGPGGPVATLLTCAKWLWMSPDCSYETGMLLVWWHVLFRNHWRAFWFVLAGNHGLWPVQSWWDRQEGMTWEQNQPHGNSPPTLSACLLVNHKTMHCWWICIPFALVKNMSMHRSGEGNDEPIQLPFSYHLSLGYWPYFTPVLDICWYKQIFIFVHIINTLQYLHMHIYKIFKSPNVHLHTIKRY